MKEIMRSNFISVRDLLEDIGVGIGKANFALWKESSSPYGILAVKTAKVNVDFELSSSAVARDESLSLNGPNPMPFLGAKTLSLSSDMSSNEAKVLNKATIILEIVSIAPDTNEKEAPAKNLKENFTQAVNLLRARLTSLKIADKEKKKITEQLNKIEELLKNDKIDEARNSLIKLAKEYSLNIL